MDTAILFAIIVYTFLALGLVALPRWFKGRLRIGEDDDDPGN